MNKFLNNLERKTGKWAIPNLTMLMIGCYVIGYILQMISPQVFSYMTLEPAYIMRGQLWRIVTWILIPPYQMSGDFIGGIFTVIMLFFYMSIGTSLERTWGIFRYNVYIFGGMLLTFIACFLSYFIFSAIAGQPVLIGEFFSTYYLVMSMFLAFSATFPEARVYLYFIIPIKVKWLGILYFVMMLYDCGSYFRFVLQGNLYYLVPIIAFVASLLNFFIFFFSTRDFNHYSPKEIKRRRDFQKSMAENRARFAENVRNVRAQQSADSASRSSGKTARHRCVICGRTELTDPELEFRFCTKCEGNHEYCMEHLYTHKHIITDHAGSDLN